MNIFSKIHLYYSTLRHLKLIQVYFQAHYRFKKLFSKTSFKNKAHLTHDVYPLSLEPGIPSPTSWDGGNFNFLNQKKTFADKIHWDFKGYGKLWTYNLNYFEYLNQPGLDLKEARALLDDFCSDLENRKEGTEPYPISLRGINWIKFFTDRGIRNAEYDRVLFLHYRHLASNLEYHLLGNHLLENGFALLFGSYYFRHEAFYQTASNILRTQLREQILDDGAHFELSPMYHQTLLFRLLDTINLVKNNSWKKDSLLSFLNEKALSMVSWLRAVTFRNGDVPMVNDSAFGIAPSSDSLFAYAQQLGVAAVPTVLSDSGYEMVRSGAFELFLDVGDIGPDYIPGHAHSDTLNFILHFDGRPIIVDTGTSTYDRGVRRTRERSTLSHNTVMVNEQEQSEIWASFRVGRRAKIIECTKHENWIHAIHDGYKRIGVLHGRTWQWADHQIVITDNITGKTARAVASIHFHPDVTVMVENKIYIAGPLRIEAFGHEKVTLTEYEFAEAFNRTVPAKVLRLYFKQELRTIITF